MSNNTEIFAAFLQPTSPDFLTVTKHGFKGKEVIQHMLEGYTLISHFCRKDHKEVGLLFTALRT
jgi:hypothetical protein